jgi:hypothetical protein
MPYFCAVPATTSSTPLASPPEEMILADSGSVFFGDAQDTAVGADLSSARGG